MPENVVPLGPAALDAGATSTPYSAMTDSVAVNVRFAATRSIVRVGCGSRRHHVSETGQYVEVTSAVLTIATPLGELPVAVTSGAGVAHQPSRTAQFPSGAQTAIWDDMEGLVVDSLLTRYEWTASESPDWAPVTCWGAEFRLHARADTPLIRLSALLPEGVNGGWPDGDEDIEIVTFETDEWTLALGGPDDVVLVREASEGRQPPTWREVEPPQADSRGLVWHLPAMSTGDDARMYVTVAWSPTGHPRSSDTPWFAVDVSPAYLRQAAGVRLVSFPSKRRRRPRP